MDDPTKIRRWTSILVPLLLAGLMLAMLGVRWTDAPIDVYGEEGAEYIEHFDRLRTVQHWRENGGNPIAFLVAADNAYPPGLHALTLPAGALTGHSAEAVTWFGACWYLMLALGLGLCTWGLTEKRSGFAAGCVGGLLLPAAHGAALRYYYDLPMTALLWLGLGLTLTLAAKRPLSGGLLGGGCMALACLIKWTSLVFALPMLLAALITPRMARGHRALLAGTLALGFLLPSGSYLSQTTRSWTEMMSTFVPESSPLEVLKGATQRSLRADPWLQAPDRGDRSGGRLERAVYYGRSLVTAVYSPGLALFVVGLGGLWAWRRGRGGLLVGLIVVGQGLFVVAVVPPLDERFLLTLAPAGVLAAVLGWEQLPHRVRGPLAAAAIVVGLTVAADFHLRSPPDNTPRPPPEIGILAPSAGLGLNSSWEQRGWGRSDRARERRLLFRERLWATVEEASAQRVGIIGGPLIDPYGDILWWRYRALLGEIEGSWGRRGALELVALCGPGLPPAVDIVIASDTRVQSLAQPWCPVMGEWKAGRKVPAEGQHRGAVVWLPKRSEASPP